MEERRLPAPRGTNSSPRSCKPASPFIRLPPGSYIRKERPSRGQPERRCTGIKVQIMATTTPFREWQLPPAHPHPGAGIRLLLPPLPADHPLRQCWIWRGPSRGEVRRRAEPPPLRGRESPSFFTCPCRVLPVRPGGPWGCPRGVNPLPAFPRFTRAASRASETDGTPPLPPPARLAGLSPGRGPLGAIAAPRGRGELGAMPPGPRRGSRRAPRPGAARPVPPRGLCTHPRRSGSSRS